MDSFDYLDHGPDGDALWAKMWEEFDARALPLLGQYADHVAVGLNVHS